MRKGNKTHSGLKDERDTECARDEVEQCRLTVTVHNIQSQVCYEKAKSVAKHQPWEISFRDSLVIFLVISETRKEIISRRRILNKHSIYMHTIGAEAVNREPESL